jgi:DNA-binding NtrC family response regulator
LVASTPSEALRLAEQHPGEIALLISDVIMPGLNGRDLSAQLHAHCPALKVLFMSGYTADVIAHHGILDPGVNFMQKPFSLEELANRVSETLNQE